MKKTDNRQQKKKKKEEKKSDSKRHQLALSRRSGKKKKKRRNARRFTDGVFYSLCCDSHSVTVSNKSVEIGRVCRGGEKYEFFYYISFITIKHHILPFKEQHKIMQNLFPVYYGHGVEKSFPDSLRPRRSISLVLGNVVMSLAWTLGLHDGILSRMEPSLILKKACKETGLSNFDDPDGAMFDNLTKALDCIEDSTQLHSLGRYLIHLTFQHYARNRLRVVDYIDKNPTVRDQRIRSPIFIIGMARTGTTFLHGLLSCDEKLRSPTYFDMAYPQFPPLPNGKINKTSAEYLKAERELAQWKTIVNNIDETHFMSVESAEECLVILTQNWSSLSLVMYGCYDFLKSYMKKEAVDSFIYHKKFLQYLQSNSDDKQWLLKSPWHLNQIETIKKVYPDAKFIWTHRDPKEALPSWCSLVTKIMGSVTNHLDLGFQGKKNLELFSNLVNKAMEQSDQLPQSDIAHVAFKDIRENPLDVINAIYDQFGMEITPSLQSKMKYFIEDFGKQAKKVGKHKHQLEWFKLTSDQVDESFSNYTARYKQYLEK